MNSGVLITFEGIDGSGKTTQLRRLVNYLFSRNKNVRSSREPGGSLFGEYLFRSLRSLPASYEKINPVSMMFIMLADRHQHVERIIRPAMDGGEILVLDRYVDSTLAYQCYGAGLQKWDYDKLIYDSTEGFMPNLTFLLRCPPGVALARKPRCEQPYENVEFLSRVAEGYDVLASMWPTKRWRVIDATKDEDVVADEIICETKKYLGMGE